MFGLCRTRSLRLIKDGQVDWRPAVDPNRIVVMVGMVVIAYLLSRPRMARARAKAASS